MKFFDRYEVEKVLGKGSAGTVYLCRDTLLGSLRVAVKVLPPWILDKPKQRARIAAEALVLRSLKSPYTVQSYAFHHSQECTAIVMEHVEGQTLRALVDSDSDLSIERKCSLVQQLLQGLAHIHSHGLVHRDIKPENIIIPPHGNLKIIDFGLITSKGTGKEVQLIRNSGHSNSVVGTSYYLPPEVLEGVQTSQRTDLYAATMVIFELFMKADIFDEEGLYPLFISKSKGKFGKAYQALSEDLQKFIRKGLAPRPEDRFENAEEMLRGFRQIVLRSGAVNEGEFARVSEQETVSCALMVSAPIISGVYRSAKTVQFSFDRFRRSRNDTHSTPLLRSMLPGVRLSVTLALCTAVVALAGVYSFSQPDALSSVERFWSHAKERYYVIEGGSISARDRLINFSR